MPGVSRTDLYYRGMGIPPKDLSLMRELDRQYRDPHPTVPGTFEADECVVGTARHAGEPEVGAAADAQHEAAGYLPAASHPPTSDETPELSRPAEVPDDTRANWASAPDIICRHMARGLAELDAMVWQGSGYNRAKLLHLSTPPPPSQSACAFP